MHASRNRLRTRNRLRNVAWFVFAVTTALPTASIAGEWNQWRGPGRDGIGSGRLIDKVDGELKPLWQATEKIPSGGEGGWSSPLVSEGRVYLFAHFRKPGHKHPPEKFPGLSKEKKAALSDDELKDYEKQREVEQQQRRRDTPWIEVLYCFDAADGSLKWKNEADSAPADNPHSNTPAIVGGKVYVLGAPRTARCIDAATGNNLWKSKLPVEGDQSCDSSFIIADGVAVVLAGELTGLKASNGDVLWTQKKASGRSSSPSVWKSGDREFALVNTGGQTVCIDPLDGKELWRAKSEAGNSTPVVRGDLLLTFGDSRKKGLRAFTLSREGAKHEWTFQGASDPGASPVVVGGHCYVQGETRLACVDLKTGEADWTADLDLSDNRYTSLVAADGKILYVQQGLLMFAAKPDAYEPLITLKWKDKLKPLECASPALVDGKLFVRTHHGLACWDLTRQ